MSATKFYHITSEALDETIRNNSLYFLYDNYEIYYDDPSGNRRKIVGTYIYPTESFRLNDGNPDTEILYIVAETCRMYIYDESGWICLNKEKFYYFEIPHVELTSYIDNETLFYTAICTDERIKSDSVIEYILDPSVYQYNEYLILSCICSDGEADITLKCENYTNIEGLLDENNLPTLFGRLLVHNGEPSTWSILNETSITTASVRWFNWNNNLIQITNYIVDKESVPQPEAYSGDVNSLLPQNTETEEYAFDGWDVLEAEDNTISYKLRYKNVDTLEVNWIDRGEIYHTEYYKSNERPPISTFVDNPEDIIDGDYICIFKEWEYKEDVDGNPIYESVYEKIPRRLTATWYNYNNEVIYEKIYLGSLVPDPDREFNNIQIIPENNSEYSYEFVKWNVEEIDSGVKYTPNYLSIKVVDIPLYFKNIDDSTIEVLSIKSNQDLPADTLFYGKDPVYPYEEEEEGYQHKFIGWNDIEIVKDENDIISHYQYIAKFMIGRICTATWYHSDNMKVLQTMEFLSINTPPYDNRYNGVRPKKDETDLCVYIFNGWKKETLENGDIHYIAQFEEVNKYLTVYYCYWKDIDGTTLYMTHFKKDESCPNADMYPYEDPSYTNDITGYRYEFKGWDTSMDSENKNVIYTASYNKIKLLNAIWLDEDLTELYRTTFVEGSAYPDAMNDYNGKRPVKEEDKTFIYIFNQWDRSFDDDGNVIYTALYIAIEK